MQRTGAVSTTWLQSNLLPFPNSLLSLERMGYPLTTSGKRIVVPAQRMSPVRGFLFVLLVLHDSSRFGSRSSLQYAKKSKIERLPASVPSDAFWNEQNDCRSDDCCAVPLEPLPDKGDVMSATSPNQGIAGFRATDGKVPYMTTSIQAADWQNLEAQQGLPTFAGRDPTGVLNKRPLFRVEKP